MKIVVLGSGSKGNATYIETPSAKILIDAGLSYLEIKKRLASKGIILEKLDAIFITHEHIDHIGGLARTMKMTGSELFINEESYYNMRYDVISKIDHQKVYFIDNHKKYYVKGLAVIPIAMSHDAANCFGFLLNDGINTYAHMTDTGIIKKEYFKILQNIDTILIESNHDLTLLENSNRPYYLIKRIASNKGHLSNVKCVNYLKEIVSENTKRIILAHLSEECNEPEIAVKEIINNFGEKLPFELLIANQYVPLDPIEIGEQDV